MALKSNIKFKTKSGKIVRFLKKEKKALTKAEKSLIKRAKKGRLGEKILVGGTATALIAATAPEALVIIPTAIGFKKVSDILTKTKKPRKPKMMKRRRKR